MSSLAASRADGYYYPPDYDGEKHGSINAYNNSHPLGKRARNYGKRKNDRVRDENDNKNESKTRRGGGFLVVRFEMPFNAWCTGCGALLAKGIRFNARKFRSGNYYSTPVYTFTMFTTCCCSELEIVADPEKCDYIIIKGARRRSGEEYVNVAAEIRDGTAETLSGGVMEALERQKDRANQETRKKDPMAMLERQNEDTSAAAEERRRLESIRLLNQDVSFNDYSANKALRRSMRTQRKMEQSNDNLARHLNLPCHLRLLPVSQQDTDSAKHAMRIKRKDASSSSRSMAHEARKRISKQSIFGPTSSALSKKASSSDILSKGTLHADHVSGCLGTQTKRHRQSLQEERIKV